jgi:hypothetical protein
MYGSFMAGERDILQGFNARELFTDATKFQIRD